MHDKGLRLAPTTGHLQGQQQHLSELSIFCTNNGFCQQVDLTVQDLYYKVSIINDYPSSFELHDSQSF
jgi:hypothetical protein